MRRWRIRKVGIPGRWYIYEDGYHWVFKSFDEAVSALYHDDLPYAKTSAMVIHMVKTDKNRIYPWDWFDYGV